MLIHSKKRSSYFLGKDGIKLFIRKQDEFPKMYGLSPQFNAFVDLKQGHYFHNHKTIKIIKSIEKHIVFKKSFLVLMIKNHN